MSKVYTTFEMIKKGIENPALEFETTTINGRKHTAKAKRFDGVPYNPYAMHWIDEDTPLIINNVTIDYKWTLVKKPVDFMTAINSDRKIKYETWCSYYKLSDTLELLKSTGNSSDIVRLINGKWYVED
jgi:hypothetical protein